MSSKNADLKVNDRVKTLRMGTGHIVAINGDIVRVRLDATEANSDMLIYDVTPLGTVR